MASEVFREIKHQFLANKGEILHNFVFGLQEIGIISQLLRAPEGKIERDGQVLVEGRVLNLYGKKMFGIIANDGFVHLPNLVAGDKIVVK